MGDEEEVLYELKMIPIFNEIQIFFRLLFATLNLQFFIRKICHSIQIPQSQKP